MNILIGSDTQSAFWQAEQKYNFNVYTEGIF